MKNTDKIKTTPLAEGISMQLYDKAGDMVFQSSGKWLYPLFEADDYIHAERLNAPELFLHDRVAGRAAASLVFRMGIKRCFIDTISKNAVDVFEKFGVDYGYNLLVDRIKCRTEDLITSEMEINEIYRMLRQRAGRLQGARLEVRDLYAGYEGKTVLERVNLKMQAGEQIIVTGDAGAGKSTLLKVLAGVISPVSGAVFFNDEVLAGTSGAPPQIGYFGNNIKSLKPSVAAEEFVSSGLNEQDLGSSERNYQIEIAMRGAGCFHLAGRSIDTFSDDEIQRVFLARCMAQKAGLILLDGPALFPEPLENVVHSLMPTIVLVSNDPEWARQLGWPVLALENGRLSFRDNEL